MNRVILYMIIYKRKREKAFIETITGEFSNSLPVLRIFINVWSGITKMVSLFQEIALI